MSFIEPPSHLDDTSPNRPIRQESLPAWRRMAGIISLLLAVLLTVGTALLVLLPQDESTPPPPTSASQVVEQPTENLPPTEAAPAQPTLADSSSQAITLPTLSPEEISAILSVPIPPKQDGGSIQLVRNSYDPFTLIPDRPRSEVIGYTVVDGDTIFSIAERFGLKPETIAWSNDRTIIEGLRPGMVINILPVDGVYHTVVGSKTIAEIAKAYQIDDPYVIIDSEYNNLFGATPDTVLPSGTQLVIPGGVAEQISWTPRVDREGGDAQSGGNFVSFAPGEAGSCGRVANSSGTYWASPLDTWTFVRGFSSWHTGVDLADPIGTPVKAANGGTVIFAGWNSWGYGNTVVLSHGPFTTLYGHMSAIYARCGQVVSTGTVIGAVGSSGNSSGPHLHFEIRYLDVPQNPTATLPF